MCYINQNIVRAAPVHNTGWLAGYWLYLDEEGEGEYREGEAGGHQLHQPSLRHQEANTQKKFFYWNVFSYVHTSDK